MEEKEYNIFPSLNIPVNIHGIKVVQDIDEAKEAVLNGETVTRFEFGSSLEPYVSSGEYLILKPITESTNLKKYDVVLADVDGFLMTHMIVDVKTTVDSDDKEIKEYLIGNGDESYAYGWTRNVYAICERFDVNFDNREFVKVINLPLIY